jgi:hypothetical protein
MINDVHKFKAFDPETFSKYGVFLSEMLRKTIDSDSNIEHVLDTGNNSTVFVPDFFMYPNGIECIFPWKQEELKEYNRDNLLISYLASRLTKGSITLIGNVGNFFAAGNNGADITLNGECSWRPCYKMHDGRVTINGTSGHDLAVYATKGDIFVNGHLRSIGYEYTDAIKHNIYHNGKLMSKEQVVNTSSHLN